MPPFDVFIREAGAGSMTTSGSRATTRATEELSEATHALAPEVLIAEAGAPGVEDPTVAAMLERELVGSSRTSQRPSRFYGLPSHARSGPAWYKSRASTPALGHGPAG